MEPVRILHIVPNMDAGGIETFLMNVYRNIDREKVQFDFLVHYKDKKYYDDEIEALGGKIYRFSVRNDYNFGKYVIELKRFFREHTEYLIVHGHMASLAYLYLKVAEQAGVPIRIVHSHGDSALHNIKGRIKWILFKFAKIHANYYFACSKVAGKYLFGNQNFNVIQYPIDVKKFVYNEEIREKVRRELKSTDKLVLGHVGRFNLQKNHSFLIDIFYEIAKKREDAVLWLVGKGELEEEIRTKVKKLKLDNRVCFLGVRGDINKIYQGMDLMLFPSLFEGLGIVNLEAQASGLDELMTNTIPEEAFVTDLAHPMKLSKTAQEWAEKALKIIEYKGQRKNYYEEIREAGFDIDNTTKRLQEFYLTGELK